MTRYGTDNADYLYNVAETDIDGLEGPDVIGSSLNGFTGTGGGGDDTILLDKSATTFGKAGVSLIASGGSGNDWLVNRSGSMAATDCPATAGRM